MTLRGKTARAYNPSKMKKISCLLGVFLAASASASVFENPSPDSQESADFRDVREKMNALGRGKLDLPESADKSSIDQPKMPTLEKLEAEDIPHADKRGLTSVTLTNGWSVGGEIGGGWLSKGGAGGYGGVYAQKTFGQFLFLKGVLGYGRFGGHSEGQISSQPIGQEWVAGQDPAWPEGSLYNKYDRTMQYRDLTVQIGPSMEAGVQTPRLGDPDAGVRLKLSAVMAMASVRQHETLTHFVDYTPTDASARPYADYVPSTCYWVPNLVTVTYCYDVYAYDPNGYPFYDHTECQSRQEDQGYYQCSSGGYVWNDHRLAPFSTQSSSAGRDIVNTGWRLVPGFTVGVELGNKQAGVGVNYRMLFLPQGTGRVNMFTVDGHLQATDE